MLDSGPRKGTGFAHSETSAHLLPRGEQAPGDQPQLNPDPSPPSPAGYRFCVKMTKQSLSGLAGVSRPPQLPAQASSPLRVKSGGPRLLRSCHRPPSHMPPPFQANRAGPGADRPGRDAAPTSLLAVSAKSHPLDILANYLNPSLSAHYEDWTGLDIY